MESINTFQGNEWAEFDDRDWLFKQINPVDDRIELGDDVVVRVRPLPMYDEVRLLWLSSENWGRHDRICFLKLNEQLFRLDGTSPPIHDVNAKAPIQLSDENVLNYLWFFCFFVRGAEGPFYIVYDLDDDILPEGFADIESKSNNGIKSPRNVFAPPASHGRNESGQWRISVRMVYSNAFFYSDFLIHPTGMCEMLDDLPLLADLPCSVDASLSPAGH